MGAEFFIHRYAGENPQEALRGAIDQAQYNYGHAGYTGTIAEKIGAIPVLHETIATSLEAMDHAEMEHFKDPRIDDKWGDEVLVIPTEEKEDGKTIYVFAGWASS